MDAGDNDDPAIRYTSCSRSLLAKLLFINNKRMHDASFNVPGVLPVKGGNWGKEPEGECVEQPEVSKFLGY